MTISSDNEYEKAIVGSISSISSLDILSPNHGPTAVQVTGTWVGTFVIEGSNDGTNWAILNCLDLSNQKFIDSFTANGMYLVDSNPYSSLQIRCSAYTSGTANIAVSGGDAVSTGFNKSVLIGKDGITIGNVSDSLKVTEQSNIDASRVCKNTYNEVAAVASGVVTTIVTYTVPAATLSSLERISFSGQNIAEYTVLVNNVAIDKTRTNFGSDLSGAFDFISKSSAGLILSSGDQVKLNVLHARPMVGSFESRIQVVEFT